MIWVNSFRKIGTKKIINKLSRGGSDIRYDIFNRMFQGRGIKRKYVLNVHMYNVHTVKVSAFNYIIRDKKINSDVMYKV